MDTRKPTNHKLLNAIKLIRKELVIKDEPLKAYKLLALFHSFAGLDLERRNTKGMIRHMFTPGEFKKAYDIPVDDCDLIEGREFVLNAGERYARYQWVINEVKNENATSFLDLGCYIGSLVTTIANMGVSSTGVDFTSASIEKAIERAKDAGVNCKFVQCDVTKYDETKADMVSSMEVIEHVKDPEQYINHICSLTNSYGWGLVSTPNGPYGNGEGNVRGGWEWRGEKDYRGHVRVFTMSSMKDLLKKCGCEIGLLTEGVNDGLLWVKFRKKV